MKRFLIRLAIAAGLASGLAACNHHDNGAASNPTTPTSPTAPPAAKFAAFGTGFSTDFAAGASTEPVAVSATDVTAVNTTAEPSAVT